jgi:hypothetical protein
MIRITGMEINPFRSIVYVTILPFYLMLSTMLMIEFNVTER